MRQTRISTNLQPSRTVKGRLEEQKRTAKRATTSKPPAPAKRTATTLRARLVRALISLKGEDRGHVLAIYLTELLASRGIKRSDPRFADAYRRETEKLNAEILEARG